MTSTIALIERLKATGADQRLCGHRYTAELIDDAATELTTLLQRAEKAEQERDNLGSSLRECSRYRGLAEEQAEIAEVALREETKIVDRVWAALGISTYEQAGGKEISEIVADWKERCEKAEAERDAASKDVGFQQRRADIAHRRISELNALLVAGKDVHLSIVREAERQRDEALKALTAIRDYEEEVLGPHPEEEMRNIAKAAIGGKQ